MANKTQRHTIEITRDMLEVVAFVTEPDPNWRYVDKHGHEHRWYIPKGAESQDQQYRWRLPSLRAVRYLAGHYPDGSEEWDTHYYCRKCGELIKPGYKSSVVRKFVPTVTYGYIDGEPATKEEIERAIKQAQEEDNAS